MTNYAGVAPEDIESAITIPIEKKLKGLEGVKKIESSSTEGMSSIVIEFVAGTDIDDVLPKTKDKVDLAKAELPQDLEDDPEVMEINISELPIVVFSLSGTCGLECLKEIAEDLEEEFESIPGVLEVDVTGGLEREIRVEPYPDKLAYFGLSILMLQDVIAQENQNVSGGAIRMGDGRFQLRVPGEFRTPDEIYGLIVGVHDGQPVYLRDVARVVDGFKDEEGRSRLNGQEAVNIQIKKRAGENILDITDKVSVIVDEKRHTWPTGTEITKLMDQAKDIRMMVSDLENNIITGSDSCYCRVVVFPGNPECCSGEHGDSLFNVYLLCPVERPRYHIEHGCPVFTDPGTGNAGGQRHRNCRKYLSVYGTGGAENTGRHESNERGGTTRHSVYADNAGCFFPADFLAGHHG